MVPARVVLVISGRTVSSGRSKKLETEIQFRFLCLRACVAVRIVAAPALHMTETAAQHIQCQCPGQPGSCPRWVGGAAAAHQCMSAYIYTCHDCPHHWAALQRYCEVSCPDQLSALQYLPSCLKYHTYYIHLRKHPCPFRSRQSTR